MSVDTIIICPECGAELDVLKHDVEAHCVQHWRVSPRHLDRVRNDDARARYQTLMGAKAEIDAALSAEGEEPESTPASVPGTGDIIEGVL